MRNWAPLCGGAFFYSVHIWSRILRGKSLHSTTLVPDKVTGSTPSRHPAFPLLLQLLQLPQEIR